MKKKTKVMSEIILGLLMMAVGIFIMTTAQEVYSNQSLYGLILVVWSSLSLGI